VRQSMELHWEVYSGGDCWSPDSATFLSGFIVRKSPLARIHAGRTDER